MIFYNHKVTIKVCSFHCSFHCTFHCCECNFYVGIGEQVSKSLRSLSVKNLEELMQNGIEVKEENDDEKGM